MSNQDLYELVLNMRAAALHLPSIQCVVVQLLDFLAERTNEQAVNDLQHAGQAMGVAALGLFVLYISWLWFN